LYYQGKKKKNSKLFYDNVENMLIDLNKATFWKDKKLDSIQQRKVKSYNIYKTQMTGDTVLKLNRRVKLKEYKDHFCINETNKVVGWTPDYVGASKSKLITCHNYISQLTKECLDEIYKVCSGEFVKDMFNSLKQQRIVYSPGYDTSNDHLREYFKDNVTNFSVEEIFEVLDLSKFKWFETSKVSFYNPLEIWNLVRVNERAYAGHYTSKIFGDGKGNSDFESRNVAKRLWEFMRVRPLKNLYLWSILGREKDIKVTSTEQEVSTRVIMACENPATTLLMWFAQKISLYIGNTVNYYKSFNILGEHTGEKTNKLYNYEDLYDYKLEADWTFFDSNIDTNFLIAAGLIICNGMPKDNLHNNIRYYIIKSICTKYVVTPPGVVVELNRSNASGHPFTTLVNCTVNLIYWSMIGKLIYGNHYADCMRVEVYGDDTIAYFKHNPKLFNIDQYIKSVGLKSEPVLDNLRLCNFECDTSQQIDFLKRRINPIGMTWNHKKMFDKLFYQSKNRDIQTQIELLNSYYDVCKNDEDLFNYVKVIYKHIRSNESLISQFDRDEVIDLLKNKEFNNEFEILNKDEKYFNFYSTNNLISSYNKYMKIYNFSVIKNKYEQLVRNKLFNSQSIPTKVLYLFAFSRDDAEDAWIRGEEISGRPKEREHDLEKLEQMAKFNQHLRDKYSCFLKRLIKRFGD
jgi:hypothetical protein